MSPAKGENSGAGGLRRGSMRTCKEQCTMGALPVWGQHDLSMKISEGECRRWLSSVPLSATASVLDWTSLFLPVAMAA